MDQVERPQCGVSAEAQVLFADWDDLPVSQRALSDHGRLPTYKLGIAKVLVADKTGQNAIDIANYYRVFCEAKISVGVRDILRDVCNYC